MQAYLVSYRNYLHCPSTVVIPNRIDASTGNPLQFSISPNPSKGVVKLKFETVKSGKVNIMITDIEGNQFFSDSLI